MRKLFTVIGIIAIISLVRLSFVSAERPVSNGENEPAKKEITVEKEADHLSEAEKPSGAIEGIKNFFSYTGFANATPGHIAMLIVGLFFIIIAIEYNYEPLL